MQPWSCGTDQDVYPTFRKIFLLVKRHLALIPTHPTGCWGFDFCSKKDDLFSGAPPGRLKIKIRYDNEAVHRSPVSLPNFVRGIAG